MTNFRMPMFGVALAMIAGNIASAQTDITITLKVIEIDKN